MTREQMKQKMLYNMSTIEDGMYSCLMEIHNNRQANNENLELYLDMIKECIELNNKIK